VPRVRDLGYVAEERLPALLSGAIAYLNPSLYEGSAIGAMEAMACGTPPIVAPTGALPRAVDRAGIVLDAFDTEAWADALRALASTPELRAGLSRNALRLTVERRAHPPDLAPLLRALGAV
jgi:glycosyltransferase involved in cell wall biosynthesis